MMGVGKGDVEKERLIGGEIGKELDFLLQEMNRETNTILSKTSGASDAAMTSSQAVCGQRHRPGSACAGTSNPHSQPHITTIVM